MQKSKLIFMQIAISLIIVIFWWIFFVNKNGNPWQGIYDSNDKSIVEIFSLAGTKKVDDLKTGTGFIINLAGENVILTNSHVIANAAHLFIRFSDKVEAEATLVDASGLHDIAVLKANGTNLNRYRALPRGDSTSLKIGEEMMTIGHPIFESHHISVGFYSGKFTNKRGRTLLRLSMTVDPGNSGGPLFNREGEVVGIICQKVKESANIAFAVPVEKAGLLNLSR